MCTTVYVHAHVCVFSESHGKNTERGANSSYAPCFNRLCNSSYAPCFNLTDVTIVIMSYAYFVEMFHCAEM